MKIYCLITKAKADSNPRVIGAYKSWDTCYRKEKELKEMREKVFSKSDIFDIWIDEVILED